MKSAGLVFYSEDEIIIEPVRQVISRYAGGIKLSNVSLQVILNEIPEVEMLESIREYRKGASSTFVRNNKMSDVLSMSGSFLNLNGKPDQAAVEQAIKHRKTKTSIKQSDAKHKPKPEHNKETSQLEPSQVKFANDMIKSNLKVHGRMNTSSSILIGLKSVGIKNVTRKEDALSEIVVTAKGNGAELYINHVSVSVFGEDNLSKQDELYRRIGKCHQRLLENAQRGISTKVIWLIEDGDEGRINLDEALGRVRKSGSLINLLSFVHDQEVIRSYDLKHTCYLVSQFVQGYFERRLVNPISLNDGSVIGKTRTCRVSATGAGDEELKSSLLELLLSKVDALSSEAKASILSYRLSIKELSNYTMSDYAALDGVTPKDAALIMSALASRA